jgi:hypothetical protein
MHGRMENERIRCTGMTQCQQRGHRATHGVGHHNHFLVGLRVDHLVNEGLDVIRIEIKILYVSLLWVVNDPAGQSLPAMVHGVDGPSAVAHVVNELRVKNGRAVPAREEDQRALFR